MSLRKYSAKHGPRTPVISAVHLVRCITRLYLSSPFSKSESSSTHLIDIWQAVKRAIFRAHLFCSSSTARTGATTSRNRCWSLGATLVRCFLVSACLVRSAQCARMSQEQILHRTNASPFSEGATQSAQKVKYALSAQCWRFSKSLNQFIFLFYTRTLLESHVNSSYV